MDKTYMCLTYGSYSSHIHLNLSSAEHGMVKWGYVQYVKKTKN